MRDNTPPHHHHYDPEEMEALEGEMLGDEDIDDDDELIELNDDDLELLQRRLQEEEDEEAAEGTIDEEPEYENDDADDVEDKAIFTFQEHKQPVFCCDLHPEYDVAVTGGQEDAAFVWDTTNGQIIHKIEHTDTLTTAKFNYNGKYLCTADLAGNVFVYKIEKSSATETNSEQASSSATSGVENSTKSKYSIEEEYKNSFGDISWCFWHDRSNVLFAGGAESGEIYMWRKDHCKVFAGPGDSCLAGELSEDGKKLFASYNNGSIRLWDLSSGSALFHADDQHSNEPVPAVACNKNGSLYASGGKDGKIVFSSQNGPVQSVQVNEPIECLAFSPSPELRLLASGGLEGDITIWDYARYTKRSSCKIPEDRVEGITVMKWLSDNTLAVGIVLGDIYLFDGRTGALKCQLTGHRGPIYDISYSRRTNLLLGVGEDGCAKLFSVVDLVD